MEKMTHEDYLYLIEFHLKRGQTKEAEQVANIMKSQEQYKEPEYITQGRQRLMKLGYTPRYL